MTFNLAYKVSNTGNGSEKCGNRTITVTPIITPSGGTLTAATNPFGAATSCQTVPTNFDSTLTTYNLNCKLRWTAPSNPASSYKFDAKVDETVNAFDIASASTTVTANRRTAQISISNATNGTEAGTNGSFTVSLSEAAPATETVTVGLNYIGTAASPADYSRPPDVTIPAGSTTATVTLGVVNDTVVEGDETVIVTLGAVTSGSSHAAVDSSKNTATNTIADNDTATLSISDAIVNESAGTAQMTVTLSAPTAADFTVPYTITNVTTANSDYGTSIPASPLTFAAGDLSKTITIPITIPIVDDSIDESTETATVALGAPSSNFSGKLTISDGSGTLTINDNDDAGITISPTSVSLTEGGTGSTFSVKLLTQPEKSVTVNLTLPNGSQCALDKTSLSFSGDDWGTAQEVTVTAAEDAVAQGQQTCTVSVAATSSDLPYNGLAGSDVTVTLTDNDTAGLSVQDGGGITVSETGTTDSFTVVLTSEPADTVTVTVTSSDATEGTVSPASLTFTDLNWNTPQTVTVEGVDDAEADGEVSYTVTLAASGGGYDALNATVNARTTDDDASGVIITPAGLSLSEGGPPQAVDLALQSAPVGPVTINLAADGQCTPGRSAVTFDGDNWSELQSISIAAVDDGTFEGPHGCTVTATSSAASPSDAAYNESYAIEVNITDNDSDGPSDEQVQRAFESLSYNFMAERLDLIAKNGPRQSSLAGRGVGGFLAGSNGFNVVGENGNLTGDFSFNSGALAAVMGNGQVAVPTADIAEPVRSDGVNVWVEGRFGIFDDAREGDDGEGSFFLGYAGADIEVMSGVVLGVMGQFDWVEEDEDFSNVDGKGWMIGPYLSAEIFENVFLDLRGMGGTSSNDIAQAVMGYHYDGDFDTTRWLAEAGLTGNFAFEALAVMPDVRLLHLQESQDDYSVRNGDRGVDVDGNTVKLTQLQGGLKLAHGMQMDAYDVRSYVGGRLFWNIDNPGELTVDGQYVSTDDVSAALSLGTEVSSESLQFGIEGTYDGLLGDDRAVSGRVNFGYRF